MRAACLPILLPGLALACPAPLPVHLPDHAAEDAERAAPGVLLAPPGWRAGDLAVVLRDEVAFRMGCVAPEVAATLADGAMVLAVPPPGPDWRRLDAALALLRGAYGAGHAVVAPGAVQVGARFGRRVRPAEAGAVPAGSSSRPSSG
jgi:hypothetical protein